jgi:hypothetical protein
MTIWSTLLLLTSTNYWLSPIWQSDQHFYSLHPQTTDCPQYDNLINTFTPYIHKLLIVPNMTIWSTLLPLNFSWNLLYILSSCYFHKLNVYAPSSSVLLTNCYILHLCKNPMMHHIVFFSCWHILTVNVLRGHWSDSSE